MHPPVHCLAPRLRRATPDWQCAAPPLLCANGGHAMPVQMILTGDVNLMNVDDATMPFGVVAPLFADAAVVFSNLECCLYRPQATPSFHTEGFFADPTIAGEALHRAGITAVGIANNVNYGEAPILS